LTFAPTSPNINAMATATPEPIELCLEELDVSDDNEPYVRCVAVSGGCLGLCFSPRGEVLWRLNDGALAELWVSQDGKLIFFRKMPVGSVSLTRSERHLELPLEKPVIVLDSDEIGVGGKLYRVYIHGATTRVAPPERLNLRRARSLTVGAAIAVGALTAGCKPSPRVNSEAGVPSATAATVLSPNNFANQSSEDAGSRQVGDAATSARAAPDAGAPDAGGNRRTQKTPPIQIRQHPPAPMPPDALQRKNVH
jgi:hypothetical protein